MPKFSLMQKTLNLEQIEGKYSAFAKCHYALPVRMSKPLARDGYGMVFVDGIEISQGKTFFMDMILKMHCMLIPVGDVAREFDKEYTLRFEGFRAEDGSAFKPQTMKFKTLPRKQRDPRYAAHDAVALRAAREGMVQLKNEGAVLPLKPGTKLNVFGAAQYMLRNSATGAGLINPRWQADFHQAIVGYRYFDTFRKPVQYPFGHGLSYTEFGTEVTSCSADENGVKVSAGVKNIGKSKGREVLQLYVGAPDGRLEKPRRVLVDFAKTGELKPGEAQALTLSADARAFASYDEATSSYVLEAGAYSLWLGESLDKAEQIGSFQIAETKTLKTVTPVARSVEDFHRMSKAEPFVNQDSCVTSLDGRFPVRAERKPFRPAPLQTTGKKKVSFAELKADPALLDDFVAQLSVDELCKLNVSTGADWYMPWGKGTAGGTPKLPKYGLPAIRVSDGNTGLNIVKPNIGFPSSCTVAASFSRELAQEVGRVIGEESRENGIAVNLGPGMNLHRNILCGRHPEYFSEDPLLAGVMAGYHAKGIESTGTMATYKHLFCNNSETSRKGSHSIVSERALRELYFRVFEIALGIQKPGCVMTSYNALNGIYPTENAEILQTLLRGEWGFDGLIMTDWCSYDTIDPVEIVKAGTDWLTEGGGKYVKLLKKAVKDGKLSADILRDNARYVIAWVLKAQKGADR